MAWSKDNSRAAKLAAEEALGQAQRAETGADYIAGVTPKIDKFTGEQTNLQTQLNDLVLQKGTDVAEVVQARGGEATLNARLNKTTAQLADTSRQTSVLSQGVSVVSASANTIASVEIEGRTLINLLGRLGRTATSATVTVEVGKFYVFVKHNQTTGAVTFVKYTGQTSLSLTWASGEYAALYEVESGNYAKIGLEWDSVAVGLRYPYVDDVKHLQGVGVIAEGENLFPPFTEGWSLSMNGTSVSPYELDVESSGASYKESTIDVKTSIGNVYYINVLGNGEYYVRDIATNALIVSPTACGIGKTFTPINGGSFRVSVRNTGTLIGTFRLSNPMLTLGNVAKPFVPRNPSYLFADVKLGRIGNVADTLYEQDGRWLLRKVVEKDVVLDGSFPWVFSVDLLGFKRVTIPNGSLISTSDYDTKAILTKYNGLTMQGKSFHTQAENSDSFFTSSVGSVRVTIPDTDTGFAEAYTPSASDIKRYFNGWKYSDGVTWTSVTVNGQTATAQVALDTKPTDYTPYKLSYVLVKPQIIDMTDKVEGALKVNGLTQISVDSGYRRTVVDGKSTWTKGSKSDYTANPVAVKLTYANSIRNAVDDVVTRAQDNTTQISIHVSTIAELYKRVKALGG